jgi:pimeloyl-ACP methyl ester carboxylesterase
MRALQGRFGLAMTMGDEAKRIFRESPVAGRMDLLFFSLGGLRSAVLMKDFWNYDLRRLGLAYKMPVYYIMGDRDRTTPYELVREYFDKLDAPRKSYYSIPDAGHFAMLDNTAAWQRALQNAVKI